MFSKAVVILAGILTILCPPQTDEKTEPSKAGTITIEELRDHMFFLASDYLEGRVVETEGYDIAVEYAASQFRQAGLVPIVKDPEGRETYYQQVPIVKEFKTSDGPLTITSPAGEETFPIDSIKFIELGVLDTFSKHLPIVFIGYGIEAPEHGWNDFEGLEIEGKIVIALMGTPSKDGEPVLPEEMNKKYSSIQGAQLKVRDFVFGKKPAALLVVSDAELKRVWDMLPSAVGRPSYRYGGDEASSGRPSSSGCVGLLKDDIGKAFFEGQDFNPYAAENQDFSDYKTFKLKGVDISVKFKVEKKPVTSRNVVAAVHGTDPDLKDQYVTVGAHLDHVPPVNGQIRNGADDNASGSIGVLEIAEAMAMNPPRRTVIFCLYAAEEVGLIGSKHFVTDCPVPIEDVIVNINLDMISRSDEQSLDTRRHYVIGSDRTSSELKEIIIAVNKRTVNWPLDFDTFRRAFGGSDHYRFHQKGIPVAFFFSGEHPDLHEPTDDPEKIDYEKMQKISQLVYEIALELANRDEPPKVD